MFSIASVDYQQIRTNFSDLPPDSCCLSLLIIHAVCLSLQPEKQEKGFCSTFGVGLKCFLSLCAPRVTKSTADGEQDKRSRGWSFWLSSEVMTLTFSVAYVILSTPLLLMFTRDLVVIAPWQLCHIKCISTENFQMTAQSQNWTKISSVRLGWKSCPDSDMCLSKVRYHRNDLAAEGTAAKCFLFGSLGIFRGLRE